MKTELENFEYKGLKSPKNRILTCFGPQKQFFPLFVEGKKSYLILFRYSIVPYQYLTSFIGLKLVKAKTFIKSSFKHPYMLVYMDTCLRKNNLGGLQHPFQLH